MHVQFDTNEIGSILEDDARSDELADAAVRSGWSLSLSGSVLPEVLAMNHERSQLARARNLLRLRKTMRSQFFIAAGFSDLVDHELSHRITSPVELDPRYGTTLYGHLHMAVEANNRTVGRLEEFSKFMAKWKAGNYPMSKENQAAGAAHWAKVGYSVPQVGALLESYSTSQIPDWLVERVVRGVHGRSRYQLQSIFVRPRRFKALLGWCSLANLIMFGDFIPPTRRGEHRLATLLKSGKNDWYDAAVAASCAYADVFVTADDNLAGRCKFLRQRGCLHFQTMTYAELLGLAAPVKSSAAS
ncbi:hypothetical protein OWM54_41855 [Myxococcus sp. MISCRS1]|uniref:hypothetical protein n=1 Tax=Myxococcus sp. MISCRS1 TaxID=2996786 RepID=UPI00226DEDDE|nr:hypothetical protein [Myxococcus sp. MISCRS1]MCY1003709.1 hypothetical protein [Myxococcus sp. MISCRS1]